MLNALKMLFDGKLTLWKKVLVFWVQVIHFWEQFKVFWTQVKSFKCFSLKPVSQTDEINPSETYRTTSFWARTKVISAIIYAQSVHGGLKISREITTSFFCFSLHVEERRVDTIIWKSCLIFQFYHLIFFLCYYST